MSHKAPKAPNIEGLNLAQSRTREGRELKNDLDMIIPNLYVGRVESANNLDLLKHLNITHILTVEDKPLDELVHKSFVYKYKFLSDFSTSNLLEILDECIEFIDNGLENSTGVLVHCLVGRSRSASIVIGYIMWKRKIAFQQALEIVKKSRNVFPNFGFRKQLKLFETLNFNLNQTTGLYRSFLLEKMAENIQTGGNFDESFFKKTDQTSQNNDLIPCYKCRKCRFELFNIKQIVEHLRETDFRADYKHKHEFYAKSEKNPNSENVCTEEIYIEPLQWLKDRLNDINGKINCPKCDAKLGNFDWSGEKCACGAWVTPAFHISKSKIDFCNF